jgi:hypothetical protein
MGRQPVMIVVGTKFTVRCPGMAECQRDGKGKGKGKGKGRKPPWSREIVSSDGFEEEHCWQQKSSKKASRLRRETKLTREQKGKWKGKFCSSSMHRVTNAALIANVNNDVEMTNAEANPDPNQLIFSENDALPPSIHMAWLEEDMYKQAQWLEEMLSDFSAQIAWLEDTVQE